jgi:uncharacterized protein (UPF0332 family)
VISHEIRALIAKAKTSLVVAEGLVREGHFGFGASRAYYAMFYVAEALLASVGQSYSSHSAVVAAFGKEFAKTGRMGAKFHRWLVDAADIRNIGDYGLEVEVSEEQARSVCTWAHDFIRAAESFLKKEGGQSG